MRVQRLARTGAKLVAVMLAIWPLFLTAFSTWTQWTGSTIDAPELIMVLGGRVFFQATPLVV